MGGGKIKGIKWLFYFSFLLKMITFAVYFYPLLHRDEYGVTVSAHCSQERPAFRKSYEGKNRINLDCCIFLI